MVDATGIEPVTPCLQRLVARKINDLDTIRLFATEYYQVQRRLGVRCRTRQPVAPGRVRWWAQNWVQSDRPNLLSRALRWWAENHGTRRNTKVKPGRSKAGSSQKLRQSGGPVACPDEWAPG